MRLAFYQMIQSTNDQIKEELFMNPGFLEYYLYTYILFIYILRIVTFLSFIKLCYCIRSQWKKRAAKEEFFGHINCHRFI